MLYNGLAFLLRGKHARIEATMAYTSAGNALLVYAAAF